MSDQIQRHAAAYQRNQPVVKADGWGNWHWWERTHELVLIKDGQVLYAIDMDTCINSAGVLDWICQACMKPFVQCDDAGWLVMAFDSLLDPQRNLCSGGFDKAFDAKAHLNQPKIILD